jgi:DAK2 domain fusion protein YloV
VQNTSSHAPGDPRPENARGKTPPVTGARFRELLLAAQAWLDRHHEIVNALNVFPVPDGDTGTNMLLTMKSACREMAVDPDQTVADAAKAAAHGALMGARGNSGVILSQILRGMSKSLAEADVLTGPALATALSEGSRIAYKGVNKPVEGTILTVVRESSVAAESAAQANEDLAFVLAETVKAADRTVANTPNLLPVLAQAGKVDSGGKGLFFILEGIYREVVGLGAEPGTPTIAPVEPTGPRAHKGRRPLPPLLHGFDVQFLVEGPSLDVQAIREAITVMGDCPLVEGDETLVKVHVHVPNPGVPLGYAISLGFVTDVVVENMDDMHLPDMPKGYDPLPPRFETAPAAGPSPEPEPIGCDTNNIEGPGIIAVAPGDGLARVFRSLGTHCIISGGQTMNPSTQDLLEAIRRIPVADVIILPNNGNILMAASQAQALATGEGKHVEVVPSKSIPQGISALLALNPHADLTRNLAGMTQAIRQVRTGEVTTAAHNARFHDIEVEAGEIIGLLNDTLTCKGTEPAEVVADLLEQMNAADLEVITLYFGDPVTPTQAKDLREALSAMYPDQEIEVVEGGQPFYHYIISAE